jgi:integrase
MPGRFNFRRALGIVPGIDASEWTPRELRHPFVSVLSDAGVPVEQISQLVGHSGTTVTELVPAPTAAGAAHGRDGNGPAVQHNP